MLGEKFRVYAAFRALYILPYIPNTYFIYVIGFEICKKFLAPCLR